MGSTMGRLLPYRSGLLHTNVQSVKKNIYIMSRQIKTQSKMGYLYLFPVRPSLGRGIWGKWEKTAKTEEKTVFRSL